MLKEKFDPKVSHAFVLGPHSITEADHERIENDFTYHPVQEHLKQGERYEELRKLAKELAFKIVQNCPKGREQSLAMTNLEQAIFWANAAIARGEIAEL